MRRRGMHDAENLDLERRLFNALAATEDRNEGRLAFAKAPARVQGEIAGWRRASIAGGAPRVGKLPGETPLSLAARRFALRSRTQASPSPR